MRSPLVALLPVVAWSFTGPSFVSCGRSQLCPLLATPDIPEDILPIVTSAEASTQAAKDRAFRTTLYATGALVSAVDATTVALSLSGNDVCSNFADFLPFGDSVVGVFAGVLAGGFFGTFVKLEGDEADANRGRIYEEMLKRQGGSFASRSPAVTKQGGQGDDSTGKRKGKSNLKRKKKRGIMDELASLEVDAAAIIGEQTPEVVEDVAEVASTSFADKARDLYEKADRMAAAQALLLNKELEDRGVLEKITDETGLKVVGKGGQGTVKGEGDNE